MTEVQVDLISQLADKKARDFAGKLGDQPLTMNWVSRFNGYFSGYMHREADDYVKEESARILKKMGQKSTTPAPVYVPPVEDFEDLLGDVEGEDLLG